MKIDTLFFGDIDGCLVKGFDAGNLNHAAYIEQLKSQPINPHIMRRVKDFFVNNLYDIEERNMIVEFGTGRKASELEALTNSQLAEIDRFITDIHYYDESRGYEPYNLYTSWKMSLLIDLIEEYNPRKLIVLEDSIEIIFLTSILEIDCKREYWLVVKDKFILYSNLVDNCILESKYKSHRGFKDGKENLL